MYTVVGAVKTRTLRVLWALEELGLPYEHLAAPPGSDDAREKNPTGKVPVLLVDDVAITDSVAIMTYLADKHAGLTFAAGSIERAHQDSHTNFLLEEFDAILWMAGKHSFVLPEEHRMPAIKDSLRWEFKRSLERLVDRLGDGPFLMGETMTIADILAVHCLGWAVAAKFPVSDPVLRDYMSRLWDRPAYKTALSRAG